MPTALWFIETAAKHGNLVYYMSQAGTAPMTEDGPWGDATKGYCAGLCVRWIRLCYQDQDFAAVGGYNYGGVPVKFFNGTEWQAVQYQNKLRQYFMAVQPDPMTEAQYALGLGQMFLASELREQGAGPATGTKLCRILKQSYGCYLVSLRGERTGHAIAMRHARPPNGKGPGVLHVFDPNCGHFAWQLPAAQWPTILDGFLSCNGYNKDYKKTYVIGRASPPLY
jgi:hypothetical protein